MAESETCPPAAAAVPPFEDDRSFAQQLDQQDPLRCFREQFFFPTTPDGNDVIYLCGNSLGLQPRAVPGLVERELQAWRERAVDAHFKEDAAWYSYHKLFAEPMSRVVGAQPGEVVMMNSLTVNLHLMMVSFYRPEGNRRKVLMDWPAFPSDIYAIKTHLRTRGIDPDEALIVQEPRQGEHTLRIEDVLETIEREGEEIALVLFAGVNFLTGQLYDLPRLTQAAHGKDCIVGLDLAHAAGNVPLALHDWNVDWACWCTYKYLNAGPGAVAGCFVHERHAKNVDLPRYGGWWGNDPTTRFRMHLQPEFLPKDTAEGWQLSNPPILAMAPLRASLKLFDEATMLALREKSLRLTGYLCWLLMQDPNGRFEIITPEDDAAHGAQLSILVHDQPKARLEALHRAGVVCDFREPNIIRVAPTPLYNSYEDVWRFARTICEIA